MAVGERARRTGAKVFSGGPPYRAADAAAGVHRVPGRNFRTVPRTRRPEFTVYQG